MTGQPKARVAVLFGGRSAEHGVSCASAASIVSHLDRQRYEVTPVRIDTDGMWTVGTDEPAPAGIDTAALLSMTRDRPGPRPTVLESAWNALSQLRGTVDVVFPALHGRYGEDGSLQATLELFEIPYVGSGVLASATGLDKELTKKVLTAAGLAVADAVVLHRPDDELNPADRRRLGLPVFVKPAREGSSIGVSKVEHWAQLDEAIVAARKCDSKILVEAAVPGREIDVAVLQYPNGRVAAGPPLEIRYPEPHSFFDYDLKYHSKQATFDIPANLPTQLTAALQTQAVQVFHTLGCAGLLRVDFFLPTGTEHAMPVVNEVNTMPGFTATSQYPRIWDTTGLTYPHLLDILVHTALTRPARRSAVTR